MTKSTRSAEDIVLRDIFGHCKDASEGKIDKPQRVLMVSFFAEGDPDCRFFGVEPESRAEAIALLGEALIALGVEITVTAAGGAH